MKLTEKQKKELAKELLVEARKEAVEEYCNRYKLCQHCGNKLQIENVHIQMVQVGEDDRGNPIGKEEVIGVDYGCPCQLQQLSEKGDK